MVVDFELIGRDKAGEELARANIRGEVDFVAKLLQGQSVQSTYGGTGI